MFQFCLLAHVLSDTSGIIQVLGDRICLKLSKNSASDEYEGAQIFISHRSHTTQKSQDREMQLCLIVSLFL